MSNHSNSKLKVLYLLKILQEQTDPEHGLTMPQIIEQLSAYGIEAERKSIYADIKVLRDFDIDVRTYQRSPVQYALGHRDFSLDELMLMVDAIQSCRAITERQSHMLITNIKTLASDHERELLDRQIHVVGRIKSQSDSVFGNIDAIHTALRNRCKVEFAYLHVGVDGTRRATRNGKKHRVTPVGLEYDDGYYYLTGWDDRFEKLAEYRLDRMGNARVLEDEPAVRNEAISAHQYTDGTPVQFGHFRGEEVGAILAAVPEKAEIIIDRFGDAAEFLPSKEGKVRARVRVCKSEQFFGWIAGMGKTVTIEGPSDLKGAYYDYLRSLLEDS